MNVIIKKFFFSFIFCSTLPNCDGKWEFHWICRRDLSTRWTSSLEKCGTIGGGHGRFPSFTQQSKGQSQTVHVRRIDIYLSIRRWLFTNVCPQQKFSEETLCVSSFPIFYHSKTLFSSRLSSLWPILLGGILNTKLLNEQIDTRDGLLSYLCSSSTGGCRRVKVGELPFYTPAPRVEANNANVAWMRERIEGGENSLAWTNRGILLFFTSLDGWMDRANKKVSVCTVLCPHRPS